MAFEDASRGVRPITVLNDENVEDLVMHDRHMSVHRVAIELSLPKTAVHQTMSDHLGLKKICSRYVPKCLTTLQHVNRVACYQKLL